MKKLIMNLSKSLMTLTLLIGAFSAQAKEEFATPAISGYDPVAYFSDSAAKRGSGMHAAEHNGQVYLFSSAENKAKFKKNPSKYLPQYGGYCAFGASLGKKFHSDPTVFAVVKGKLYLNLNKDIQKKWNAKQSDMISAADKNWKKIKSKSAAKL